MGETVAEAGWRRQDEVAWRENLEVALYLRVGLGAVDDRAIGVGPVRGANLKLSLWSGLAACQVNFVEPLGKYLDRLSARQSSRQGSRRRSGDLRRRTASARLPATHISATTAEAILGSNFVASFVDTSRSRFVTIRPVVSSLFDPASVSAAGGRADLKLSLQSGLAGDRRARKMCRNLLVLGSGRKGLRPSRDRVHRRWVWRAPIPWRLGGDASEATDGSFISVGSGKPQRSRGLG